MLDRPTPHLALALLAVTAALAGCSVADSSAGPDRTTVSGPVLTVAGANETRAERAGADLRTAFDDLPPDRRAEFERALDGDLRDPTAWDQGTDVQYVRYEGRWYAVHVVVVN